MKTGSDVAFSSAVKRAQTERGSRAIYARAEQNGGGSAFETEVTDDLAAFLAEIDTAFLATASAAGQPYVQHRGGAKGFLRVIDAHTLGFIDFAGNRQYVSTGNLSENDRVCLFLIDYERRRRVKIWGTARIVPLAELTPAEREALADHASPPYKAKAEQAIVIDVAAWDVNCPQHIPQKIDATKVQARIAVLEARIRELEAENATLRAR